MWFGRLVAVGLAVVASTGGRAGPHPLLTESDLPGWTREAVVANADAAMPTRALCGGRGIAARATANSGVADGRVSFVQDPLTGPKLTELVWSFASSRSAAAFMSSVRRAAERCAGAEHVDRVS